MSAIIKCSRGLRALAVGKPATWQNDQMKDILGILELLQEPAL